MFTGERSPLRAHDSEISSVLPPKRDLRALGRVAPVARAGAAAMLACALGGIEGLHACTAPVQMHACAAPVQMHAATARCLRGVGPAMQIGSELGNGELTYPFGLESRVGRDTYADEWEEEEAYTPQWDIVLQPIAPSNTDPFQVARRVLPMLIAQMLWASGITLASFRYQLWAPPMVHSLLGGVLGLLLAFRTNQAYLRYQQLCTTWVTLATHSLNMARNAAQLDFKLYSAVLRHVIALPIAIKQRLRGTINEKEFYTSLWVTELEQIDTRQPVASIIASISMLLRPVKASDDGSGREVALWAKLELDIAEMQAVASRFDSLSLLPPPPSYSLLVSRFLLLWSATLPLPLPLPLPLTPTPNHSRPSRCNPSPSPSPEQERHATLPHALCAAAVVRAPRHVRRGVGALLDRGARAADGGAVW